MFPSAAWLALAPLLGLMGDVISHLLLSRLTSGRKMLPCLVGSFTVGLAITLGVSAFALLDTEEVLEWLASLAFNSVTFLALGFGYFAFVNLNISSVRIRVLQELLAAHQGLSATQLLACYNAEELIEKRLERITQGQQLLLKDGRLYPKPSLYVLLLHIITWMKWCILGRV